MSGFLLTNAQWLAVASFAGGLLVKTIVDSTTARHAFARDKRFAFLEDQLSKFYWPLGLMLEKDCLMYECMTAQDDDPESPASQLGRYVERNMLLSNQQEAVKLIESFIYLAQKNEVFEACMAYVKHVKVSEMMLNAGVHGIPMAFGTPYPKGLREAVLSECEKLQREYDGLVLKGATKLRRS